MEVATDSVQAQPPGPTGQRDSNNNNTDNTRRQPRQEDYSRSGSSASQRNNGERAFDRNRGRGGGAARGSPGGGDSRQWRNRPAVEQGDDRSHRGGGNANRGGRRGAEEARRPPQDRTDGEIVQHNQRQQQRRRPQRDARNHPESNSNSNSDSNAASAQPSPQSSTPVAGGNRFNRRGARFGAGLTSDTPEPSSGSASASQKQQPYPQPSKPANDDLTSSLTYALSTAPYPDCPICFAAIHPAQPVWCCSPVSSAFMDVIGGGVGESAAEQCCYAPFHLKCVRAWAAKSVKELADAWRARGEEKAGEWRCPACQMHRTEVPDGYRCFCGSTLDPKPPRLATPHSCANPCTRPRVCGHGCALRCHPGPCPPCNITTRHSCHCGAQVISLRCSRLHGAPTEGLSCGGVCSKSLDCGRHSCQSGCHPGKCAPCEVVEDVRCYCGKVAKEVPCGEGEAKECVVEGEGMWEGRFGCDRICDRPFECGKHTCSKGCHPPSTKPPPCPYSPSLITHCPCGQHPLDPSRASAFPPRSVLSRKTCSDPIPTCTSTCGKPLEGCDHACLSKCHTGPCPPCSRALVRPCRCGVTRRDIRCSELRARGGEEEREILCDKPCGALRACGRHQCTRLCCPLAALGNAKGKGKKRGVPSEVDTGGEPGGLHECDIVCGKLLNCGTHRCEARDHRGGCAPCFQSTFEEIACNCGRTVLDPPVPCGTQIECSWPCARAMPTCGHPKTQHSCHEEEGCPPCPFLTSKRCACGKKEVGNVRCAQEKVSCGTPCGKLLSCGFHHCEKLCHSDECGACNSPCGKARKLCRPASHPCVLPCHAPSACAETEPCRAIVTLTCPCGRIRQPVPCARSSSNPAGRENGNAQQLRCSTECSIAKRNARLADALGINTAGREQMEVYNDALVAFARANPKLLGLVEKAFQDFHKSEKKNQVLPHMPPDRRQFVRDLAVIYRIDTQMVDQEPHRSVQLLRRIDTRIPTPLLSVVLANSAATLGKLADLRAPIASGSWRAGAGMAVSPVPSRPLTATGGVGAMQKGWNAAAGGSRSGSPGVRPIPSPRPQTVAAEESSSRRLVGENLSAPAPVVADAPVDLEVPDDWEDDV